MRITEVKVFPVREEKLKAFVSVVFDECFMVNDIKVIRGRDGMFISMPSRRKKNGRFKDIAHPLNNDTRQMIEGVVLEEYERAVSGDGAAGDSAKPAGEGRPERRQRPPRKRRPAAAAKPAATETDPQPAAAATRKEPPGEEETAKEEDKSLEEVAEAHLRDSFWTT